MVIPICLQVVIVSDHFLVRNDHSRAKVQLPATMAVWVLPRETINRVLKGPCPPWTFDSQILRNLRAHRSGSAVAGGLRFSMCDLER